MAPTPRVQTTGDSVDGEGAAAGYALVLNSHLQPSWEEVLPDSGGHSVGQILALDADLNPHWTTPTGGGTGLPTQWSSGSHGDVVASVDLASAVPFTAQGKIGQTADILDTKTADGTLLFGVAPTSIKGSLLNVANGLAALDGSGKLGSSEIPDLSASYAALSAGKIAHSQLPSLQASDIPDLSAVYAALSGGRIAHSELPALQAGDIPNISGSYAALSGGKIAHSVLPALLAGDIPDVSETYQALSAKNQIDGYVGLDSSAIAGQGHLGALLGGSGRLLVSSSGIAAAEAAWLAPSDAGVEATANKNVASGYAGLDGGGRVASALLGAGSPSASTFLRGDQSWVSAAALASGALVTAPPASQSASLVLGTAYQNVLGYDILLVVYLSVTINTSGVVKLGVGPTSTPTQQTIVSGVSTVGFLPVVIYLPNQYYALLSITGTITDSIAGQIAIPV